MHRIDEELQVFGLRILGDLACVIHRRIRHVERLQATAPFGALTTAEDRAQQFDQLGLVCDTRLARGKALVFEQRGPLDRVRQGA